MQSELLENDNFLDGEMIFQANDPEVLYFPAYYPPEEIPRDRLESVSFNTLHRSGR